MKKLTMYLIGLGTLIITWWIQTLYANNLFQSWFWGTNYVNNIQVPGAPNVNATAASDQLITIIQNAINWVLGILSLIVLILLLRWGFQMITAAGDDDKYGSGFKILKQAAFGLVMIGLAWFIVSAIFWIINLIVQ